MEMPHRARFGPEQEVGRSDTQARTALVELERTKAERESGILIPSAGSSVVLLLAAWSIGQFWMMLAILAARLTADAIAQNIARRIVRKIDRGEEFAREKKQSELIALVTGCTWGLVLLPIYPITAFNIGSLILISTVSIVAVMVLIITCNSPRTLHRWLTGLATAIAIPLLAEWHSGNAIILAGYGALIISIVWIGARLRDQALRSILVQLDNKKLTAEVSMVNEALARSLATSERRARHDSLTGLYNRRAFEEDAVGLYQQADCDRHLLLIDIDHFKKINDRFGHGAGDEVLVLVGHAVTSALEDGELCARWGGEEFVALLLDCDAQSALKRAEMIRGNISQASAINLPTGLPVVTASIGIAGWKDGEEFETVFERADRAMYAAKSAGRNASHMTA